MEALVSVQSSIRLPDDSEPEPDLVVLRLRRYRQALPTPADILLLIEVADTSVNFDRNKKLPLYAESGIAEAWLVDLVDETIERHTEPRPVATDKLRGPGAASRSPQPCSPPSRSTWTPSSASPPSASPRPECRHRPAACSRPGDVSSLVPSSASTSGVEAR